MWIRGPLWDGFFVLSPLWVAPLLVVSGDDAAAFYLALAIVFWIGHRVSSAYLAYCTSAYRPLLRAQRARFVVAPIAMFVGVLVFAALGDGALPWTREERLFALVAVDFVLVAWHFASQHYGVLSLYRGRAGAGRDDARRRRDRWYALGVGGALVVAAEAAPDHALAPVVGTALVVAATVFVVAAELRADGASPPRALYLATIGVVVVAAWWVDPFVFVALWTVQHWTAAVGIATLFAAHDVPAGPSRWYRAWATVSRQPAALLLVLAVASAVLFPILDVEASGDAARAGDVVPWLLSVAARTGLLPLLVALGFATAFLHYQLDRAVFRFGDPEVRRAAGALLNGGTTRPSPAAAPRT